MSYWLTDWLTRSPIELSWTAKNSARDTATLTKSGHQVFTIIKLQNIQTIITVTAKKRDAQIDDFCFEPLSIQHSQNHLSNWQKRDLKIWDFCVELKQHSQHHNSNWQKRVTSDLGLVVDTLQHNINHTDNHHGNHSLRLQKAPYSSLH